MPFACFSENSKLSTGFHTETFLFSTFSTSHSKWLNVFKMDGFENA